MYLEGNRRWVPLLAGAAYAFRVTYEREGLVDKEETPALYDHLWTELKFNYFLCEYLKFVILKVPNLYEVRLVVNMATLGPNQSEREKDNRGIVLEGHVTH